MLCSVSAWHECVRSTRRESPGAYVCGVVVCSSVAAVGPKMQMPGISKMFGSAVDGAAASTAGVRAGDKVGILFLNLGGPEKLDEVEDFLFNLFNDEDIIRLPNPLKPLQGDPRAVRVLCGVAGTCV